MTESGFQDPEEEAGDFEVTLALHEAAHGDREEGDDEDVVDVVAAEVTVAAYTNLRMEPRIGVYTADLGTITCI